MAGSRSSREVCRFRFSVSAVVDRHYHRCRRAPGGVEGDRTQVGAALAQREADVSAEQPAATAWPGSVEEALAALEKAYVTLMGRRQARVG
jgi:hypothetical protein